MGRGRKRHVSPNAAPLGKRNRISSQDVPNMEVPLPLIQTDREGKMRVNEELANVLSQAKKPIGVIAIVGKYRTGKSYIMNRFFQSNAGFELGPTVQSTTKGIWVWARPNPLEPHRTLILLDMEGLSDVEKGDKTHDMKLFSLALLLSNCLVYNVMGTLDDAVIQDLHLVKELTEHIQTREDEEEEGNHFNKYFPYFFLLLRDFFLDIKLEGQDCTPNQYLENALKMKQGHSQKVNEYNGPRDCIRSYFPRRKCFTLCKPVDDDAKLRRLDAVDEQEIKPEFLDQAKEATDAILAEAKEMKVGGNPINGAQFMELVKMYVNRMNDGGVPCISSAVELLKNNECQKALDSALAVFDQIIDKHLVERYPVELDTIAQIQEEAHKAAVDHYKERSLFDNKQEYINKLASDLEKKYQKYVALNNDMSVVTCKRVLTECFADLQAKVKDGKYVCQGGYQVYKNDKDSAVSKYTQTPDKGPMAENMLNQYLESTAGEEDAVINADKDHKQDMQEKENEYKRLMDEGLTTQAEQHRALMDDMHIERKRLEEQHLAQMGQIKDYEKKHSDLLKEMMNQREAGSKQIAKMQAQIE